MDKIDDITLKEITQVGWIIIWAFGYGVYKAVSFLANLILA